MPSTPIMDAEDLGTYLNDRNINVQRAEKMIADAQALCESIVSPLTELAIPIVTRVAGRGYVTTTQSRGPQMSAAGSPFGDSGAAATAMGGIWLSRADKADLRRLAGGGGVFSVDILPTDYVPPVDRYSDGRFGWDA